MTALDLRESQFRLLGWSGSLVLSVLLWLVLAQLAIDRPRQAPPPTETMLNWVRTIVPPPSADQLARIRARERTRREAERSGLRPLTRPDGGPPGGAASRERPGLVRPGEDPGRGLPSLPDRGTRPRLVERTGSRPMLVERARPDGGRSLVREDSREGTGLERGRGGIELRSGPAPRRATGRATSLDARGALLSLPRQELDPALAGFMGTKSSNPPGGNLTLGGQPWQVWVVEEGGLLRVLLRRGDEVRLLVLAGGEMQVQAFQRGEVSRARGGLVVQSQRSGAGEAAGLREDLLKALEDLQ